MIKALVLLLKRRIGVLPAISRRNVRVVLIHFASNPIYITS
jgi:hypothetical protein